jgi:lipopolysaccharide export system protein LptA
MTRSPITGLLHFAARRLVRVGAIGLVVGVGWGPGWLGAAHAQGAPKAGPPQSTGTTVTGPPNALQGFSQNRDKPIQIDAARLEVRDKDKVATFFGDAKADVRVVQGDVTMRSKILVVFYDQADAAKSGSGKSAKAAAPGPGGSSQIRRLEAKGNVIVTQKGQTVTGESGVYDMKSNTVTMFGGVVLTQSDNVLRGDRLVVDMTTGVSRVEGGRVQGLFKSSAPPDGSGPSGAASPQGTRPGAPLPLGGGR